VYFIPLNLRLWNIEFGNALEPSCLFAAPCYLSDGAVHSVYFIVSVFLISMVRLLLAHIDCPFAVLLTK